MDSGVSFFPLVKGSSLQHRLKRYEKDGHDRKAAELVNIVAPQNLADMEFSKELLNLRRSSFTGMMMMWHIIYGMSLCYFILQVATKIDQWFSNCKV